jgi:RNA polymerase sigma-70 factor (ECF subfamily)
VKEARAGSRTAFERLVDLFQQDIFRMVFYRTRSTMDAEDLTQDIFMQAFKNLSGLRAVDRFRSWLFSIALNRVRDFNRKKRFRALFGAFDDSDKVAQSYAEINDHPEALDNLMMRDFWKQIGLLLDKLSRMEREVFLLRFTDHLTIKEISQVLAKSESTVKTHLYRALRKFKREYSLLQLLREGKT